MNSVIGGQTYVVYYYIFDKIGQLMVTIFLFYSGYGIYESIKSKKNILIIFLKTEY